MINFRKLLASFCAAAVLTGTAPLPAGDGLITAGAADAPAFVVSSAEAIQGETVEITVSAENNPGIIAFRLNADYDSSVLKLSSATAESLTKTGYAPTEVAVGHLDRTPLIFSWMDGLHGDYTYSGTLITLSFTIPEDAAPGTYHITLTYDPEDVFDNDYNNVTFTAVSGSVTVKKYCRHSYTAAIVPPTCTEKGYTVHKCSSCGDEYTDTETDALGHDYTSEVTTPASCTKEGVRTFTCTRCKDSYTETIPKLDHSYEAAIVPPTCTEKGYTVHKCSSCGDEYTDTETDALGHDYEATVIPPTETEGGYTLHTCSRCGDSYKDTFTDPIGFDASIKGKVDLVSTAPDYSALTVTAEGDNGTFTAAVNSDGSFTFSGLPDGTYTLTAENSLYVPETAEVTVGDGTAAHSFTLYLYGDCDGSGTVNMKDLTTLQKHINGWSVTVIEKAADLNGDGNASMKDLTALQRFINGWKVTFGKQ